MTSQTTSTSTSTSGDRVDLQIIGGGLSGLVAAARAADEGHRVRLFDRASLGGRARTADHDGFRLNNGPHALYVGGGLDRALANLGIEVSGAGPLLKGAQGTIGDRQDLLPQGVGSMWRTSLITGREKRRLAGLMARLGRIDTHALRSVTVDAWIEDTAGSGDLATLLKGLVNLSTYNRAGDLASADAAVANLAMAVGNGVRYLDGGWQQIVDRLEERCAATGRVEVVNAKVTSVRQTDDVWVCETSETSTEGRALVVAGLSPAATDGLLGTDFVAQAGPPVQAAVLDLGLATRPDLATLLGLDGGLYYSMHSVASGLAPHGGALVTLARYLEPGEDLEVEACKALLDQHRLRAGVADENIMMRRYLHRSTVSWGMPLAAQGGLAGRPGVEVGQGCFIAGDWVGRSGLLADAAAASAEVAVAGVVDHLTRVPQAA